jgi:hypothetical protein
MSNKLKCLGTVSSAAAGITISSSTNATPIVVTLGAGHGLKEGDRIAIAGVTGNTNANGSWRLSSVGATTATLVGSVGNGTHGGTVRVGVMMDETPTMRNHSAALHTYGNLVGTVDIEVYDNLDDFGAGVNNAGVTAPVLAPSAATQSAGSSSTPAKSTITAAVTNAGLAAEVKLQRIMRMVCTAFTSGSMTALVEA